MGGKGSVIKTLTRNSGRGRVRARSSESSSTVLTGPIGEEIHSLGFQREVRLEVRLFCSLMGALPLRLELTQMRAGLREHRAGGECQQAQQREELHLRPKLAQSTSWNSKLQESSHSLFIKLAFVTVKGCNFLCLMRSKAKQHKNIGIWSRGSFIIGPCKESRRLICSKSPKFPKGFQQAIFKVKVSDGWLLQTSWCRNPLFL